MKPKQQIDPNASGEEVKRLLAEDGTASAALKDLRSAKAARKEALKSALTVVWNAFEKKQTVNGYATRKEWAQNFAKVTTRHCEHIIYGRKPEANKRSRVVKIKPGTVVMFGKRKFTVVTLGDPTAPTDWEDEYGVHSIRKEIAGYDCYVQLNLKEINPKPALITHARGTTTKGTQSSRKARCQNRYVNRKLKGVVFAKDADVTCPDCRAMLDEKKQSRISQLMDERHTRMSAFFDTLPADMPMKERHCLFDAEEKKSKQLAVVLKEECPTEEAL